VKLTDLARLQDLIANNELIHEDNYPRFESHSGLKWYELHTTDLTVAQTVGYIVQLLSAYEPKREEGKDKKHPALDMQPKPMD